MSPGEHPRKDSHRGGPAEAAGYDQVEQAVVVAGFRSEGKGATAAWTILRRYQQGRAVVHHRTVQLYSGTDAGQSRKRAKDAVEVGVPFAQEPWGCDCRKRHLRIEAGTRCVDEAPAVGKPGIYLLVGTGDRPVDCPFKVAPIDSQCICEVVAGADGNNAESPARAHASRCNLLHRAVTAHGEDFGVRWEAGRMGARIAGSGRYELAGCDAVMGQPGARPGKGVLDPALAGHWIVDEVTGAHSKAIVALRGGCTLYGIPAERHLRPAAGGPTIQFGMATPADLFRSDDLDPELRELLETGELWEVLAKLDEFGHEIVSASFGEVHPTAILNGPVFVSEGAQVGAYALIEGPVWLGPGAQVGHAAFVRGSTVLMADARVGHASEVKRSLFLPGSRAPHFNYVGDSIIGRNANLGAGVKVANYKTFGNGVRMDGKETGLRKLGAAVGDDVSIGCNAVLAPGTVIGARAIVYNGALLRGTVPADTVVKSRLEHDMVPRQPVERKA